MDNPILHKSSPVPLNKANTMGSNTADSQTSHRSEEDELTSFVMTLWTGSVPPMVFATVVDLGVLDILKREANAGGHMSPSEIAAHLPTKNPAAPSMLDRMLRVLVSYGVLTCEMRPTRVEGRVERTYGLAPVCSFFTRNEDGAHVALMHEDKVVMESWYHLKDALLNGGTPFNKAYGMNLFEYLGTDPRFNKVFNNTMSYASLIETKKILENYDGFQGISTLVDVGGGNGTTLSMIISKYPSIKGINFDLPHVIHNAPSHPGVEHIAGDMLVSVPKGDAIFMKCICHDWADEDCLKFLKNSYDALPNQGKVIICDYVLPVAPEPSNEAKAMFQFDVLMLAICPGGKERTKDEFEYLAKATGFQSVRIACSVYDYKVIEFFKNR